LWLACLVAVLSPAPLVAQAKLTAEELEVRRKKAGNDPVLLLELVPLADTAAAGKLRREIDRVLTLVPAEEREAVAVKVAPLLPAAAPTPQELQQLLGPPAQVSRQAVYRRCVEQWRYDTPLPLCVIWQAESGREAQILTVHPLSAKNR
jgi:hypothetical protein